MLGQRVAFGVLMVLFTLFANGLADTEPNDSKERKCVTTPLDGIWGYRMPGTHNMNFVRQHGEYVSAEGQTVEEIYNSLVGSSRDKESSPAFAVQGTAMDALKNALTALNNSFKAINVFSIHEDVSVFVFSYNSRWRMNIRRVIRKSRDVEIRYELTPLLIMPDSTVNFAVIPLGKLPAGEMTIQMVKLPTGQEWINKGIVPITEEELARIVCKSFQLIVKEEPTENPALRIPQTSED
ncbi:MAG: hypothetical protein IH898_01425 [Planctomycetes bacterium]|nr:hypothetical protein [Planctomycetota bacterium]